MPRPPMSDHAAAAVRATILAKASVLVGREGLAGLSMRALAKEVGLTPGALYRYFPSKQDLLLAYWSEALAALRGRLAEKAERAPDAASAIRAMLEAYAAFGLADHDRFRMLFLENDHGAAAVLCRDEEAMAPYRLLVAKVAQAMDQGALHRDDPEHCTQILWAAVHGAVTLLVTIHEFPFPPPDLFVASTIAAVMRGLAPQEP